MRFRVWDRFNERFDNSRFAITGDGVLLRQVDVVCWETVYANEVDIDMGLVISDQLSIFENDILSWGSLPEQSAKVFYENGMWSLGECSGITPAYQNLHALFSVVGFNIQVTGNAREQEAESANSQH